MNPTVKVPTASDLQVHDLLIEGDPDNHPTDCWICQHQTAATTVDTVEDNTVDLEAQIAQLQSDLAARDSQLADLTAQLAARDTSTQIAELESKVSDLTVRAETAEAATTTVQQAFDTYKGEIEALATADAEAAAQVARGEARKAAVDALGYDDSFITDKRVEDWSKMDDPTWDTLFAALDSAKPAPGEQRTDPVQPAPTVDTGSGTSLDGGTATDTTPTSSDATRNILRKSALAKNL